MQVKVLGSHETIRKYCQMVRFGIKEGIKNIPQENTFELMAFYNSLIDRFNCHVSFVASTYPIPLEHIELTPEEHDDGDLKMWLMIESKTLSEFVYIHLAEQILKEEFQKYQNKIAV